MSKLEKSIQNFIRSVSEISFNVLPALAYLLMALIVMFQLDWQMTLLVMGFAPLPALIAYFAAPRQVSRERFLLERWGRIYSRFNKVLSGLVTVRSFTMEDYEKQRFLRDVSRANTVVVKGVRYDSTYEAIQKTVVAIARVTAIGLGVVLIISGEITIGTLVAFLGYVGTLFGPVQGLTNIYSLL